jgi:hypothetical protein
MTKSNVTVKLSLDDLIANLGAIASPADLELINNYLKLGIDQTSKDNAQIKASLRTQQYKLRKVLLREPSSQHIVQASAYVVFARYGEKTPSSQPIAREVQDLLVAAGFDKQGTVLAMARFVADAGDRKASWVARTRSGTQLAIARAINTLKTLDGDQSATS